MNIARAALLLLTLAPLLTACAEYADNTRSAPRGWCENTPRFCDVNAVK